jgi:hypothetical protein
LFNCEGRNAHPPSRIIDGTFPDHAKIVRGAAQEPQTSASDTNGQISGLDVSDPGTIFLHNRMSKWMGMSYLKSLSRPVAWALKSRTGMEIHLCMAYVLRVNFNQELRYIERFLTCEDAGGLVLEAVEKGNLSIDADSRQQIVHERKADGADPVRRARQWLARRSPKPKRLRLLYKRHRWACEIHALWHDQEMHVAEIAALYKNQPRSIKITLSQIINLIREVISLKLLPYDEARYDKLMAITALERSDSLPTAFGTWGLSQPWLNASSTGAENVERLGDRSASHSKAEARQKRYDRGSHTVDTQIQKSLGKKQVQKRDQSSDQSGHSSVERSNESLRNSQAIFNRAGTAAIALKGRAYAAARQTGDFEATDAPPSALGTNLEEQMDLRITIRKPEEELDKAKLALREAGGPQPAVAEVDGEASSAGNPKFKQPFARESLLVDRSNAASVWYEPLQLQSRFSQTQRTNQEPLRLRRALGYGRPTSRRTTRLSIKRVPSKRPIRLIPWDQAMKNSLVHRPFSRAPSSP